MKPVRQSYAEQGIDIEPTKHLGPAGTAIKRKIGESQMLDKREAERRETAQQLIEKPGELLKLISRERSTFSEQDIAKTLHRFIDDPETFANVRAAVMASPELVELRGAVRDPETNKLVAKPAYSTTEMVRIEHDMAVSADRLNRQNDFAVRDKRVLAAIRAVESKDPSRPFSFDEEQVLAVQHVTGKSGIAAVVGYAGASKSTLLEAANVTWVANGNRVFGAALAGKAAEGLEESAGIKSRTLASWEFYWKNERDLLQPIAQIADRKQRDYAVRKLMPEIKTELREFTKALEKRFDPKAFEQPDPKLIASVAHSEKARFNEIAEQMQVVRQVVNTDIEQRFLAERMQKSLSRSTGITH